MRIQMEFKTLERTHLLRRGPRRKPGGRTTAASYEPLEAGEGKEGRKGPGKVWPTSNLVPIPFYSGWRLWLPEGLNVVGWISHK